MAIKADWLTDVDTWKYKTWDPAQKALVDTGATLLSTADMEATLMSKIQSYSQQKAMWESMSPPFIHHVLKTPISSWRTSIVRTLLWSVLLDHKHHCDLDMDTLDTVTACSSNTNVVVVWGMRTLVIVWA